MDKRLAQEAKRRIEERQKSVQNEKARRSVKTVIRDMSNIAENWPENLCLMIGGDSIHTTFIYPQELKDILQLAELCLEKGQADNRICEVVGSHQAQIRKAHDYWNLCGHCNSRLGYGGVRSCEKCDRKCHGHCSGRKCGQMQSAGGSDEQST